jgi:hydroxyethylthiazole kinase
MELLSKIATTLEQIRAKKPLIHHITNYVTVNDCANITLAIGASPVMADDIKEVEDMVGLASALVLNIGTLNARTVAAMLAAGLKAKSLRIPIILDPVGVGATALRTSTTAMLIREIRPSVLRGNMSEIKMIAGEAVGIKGVDSIADERDGVAVARQLSQKLDCVVAITGKTDIIARGEQICRIDNGHEMLARITGTGCMATSLVGCFCGASDDCFIGAAAGVLTMGLAGELARQALKAGEGIGSYRMRLFDAIDQMSPEQLLAGGRISHG